MAGCGFLLLPQEALAQEHGKSISIELNKAQPLKDACRISFIVRNDLGAPLQELGIEIVVLDRDGLAQELMVLKTGSLREGKRRLRQFDLPQTDCGQIGEILINDVSECQADGMTAASCLDVIRPTHKTNIKLGL